jgi:hypothetical protein
MVVATFVFVGNVLSFTQEEQLIYDNLFLDLPWEAGIYQECTQENKSSYSHYVSGVDEYALDFGMTTGTEVNAPDYGVAYAYYASSTSATAYGNHVKVDHGYFYALYAHLSSINVSVDGTEVGPGYKIGESGNTGTSTNPHLHFGLYHGSAWIDGDSSSVESKIIIGHQGIGPYQVLQSTELESGESYLSGNFEYGSEGIIICDENNDNCYVDTIGGIGGYDQGDEGTTPDGPDANVKEVELSNYGADSYYHTLTKEPRQNFDVRIEVTNKGDEDIDYFEVFIHRSSDLDFDEDNDFSCGREEEEDDLNTGDSTAKHRTCTSPTTPGTYYIRLH